MTPETELEQRVSALEEAATRLESARLAHPPTGITIDGGTCGEALKRILRDVLRDTRG